MDIIADTFCYIYFFHVLQLNLIFLKLLLLQMPKMKVEENPWMIQSIYDLQYFNCPTCVYKNHSKQDFINHAFEFHPEVIENLNNIQDGSLNDIDFPWDIKNESLRDIDECPWDIKEMKTKDNIGDLNGVVPDDNEEAVESWVIKSEVPFYDSNGFYPDDDKGGLSCFQGLFSRFV